MKGMPPKIKEIISRNGLENDLGKELAWIRAIVIHLRHAGATEEDIKSLMDKSPMLYDWLLAGIRGDIPVILGDYVNLDRTPRFLLKEELVCSWALGIHTVSLDSSEQGGLYFSGNKVRVFHPTCKCVEDGSFYLNALASKDKNYLNAAAAEWLRANNHAASRLFVELPNSATIFCTGTVWHVWKNGRCSFYAMALSRTEKNRTISVTPKKIPDGPLQENCYIAVV